MCSSCADFTIWPVAMEVCASSGYTWIFTVHVQPYSPLNCFTFMAMAFAGRSSEHIRSLALDVMIPAGVFTLKPICIEHV